MLHARLPNEEQWQQYLRATGFQIVEQGIRPATRYFLVRKPLPECVKHVDGARAAAHIVLRKRA